MRAVQCSTYGGPEVLQVRDVPDPKAFIDVLLVRIEASAVNPADLGFQSGAVDAFVDTFFPVTPGWDLAGVVEQVGPATRGFHVGDEVIGYVSGSVLHHGTFAERIAAPPRLLARKPRNSSWAQAAGLPLAGLTAWQAVVDALEVGAGDTLLVHGAAGGVGHLAVQIARSRGARVIGTGAVTSSALIESLGATPVQYGEQLVEQVLAVAPGGVDAVFDTAGRGSLATTGALGAPGVRAASITRADEHEGTIQVFVHPDADDLAELVELVEAGRVTVHVDSSFPLAQARQAQERVASGHAHGKVVVFPQR